MNDSDFDKHVAMEMAKAQQSLHAKHQVIGSRGPSSDCSPRLLSSCVLDKSSHLRPCRHPDQARLEEEARAREQAVASMMRLREAADRAAAIEEAKRLAKRCVVTLTAVLFSLSRHGTLG